MSLLNRQANLILAALDAEPLDRVRLMKTLFLAWHRAGRPSDWPFDFRPYLYGPCAFEIYGALEALERRSYVTQAAHAVDRWSKYYLTASGHKAASAMEMEPDERKRIQDLAHWASRQRFRELLRQVYAEAPDFASRSVVRREVES